MSGFISKKKLIGEMTLKQAFFILRHGSAEGNHKYLEAVKVIEDEYNRQKAEIERLKDDVECFAEISMAYQKYFFEGEIEGLEKHFRAEAVKEFADKVIDLIYEADSVKPISEWQIDNLVKEFTEELT